MVDGNRIGGAARNMGGKLQDARRRTDGRHRHPSAGQGQPGGRDRAECLRVGGRYRNRVERLRGRHGEEQTADCPARRAIGRLRAAHADPHEPPLKHAQAGTPPECRPGCATPLAIGPPIGLSAGPGAWALSLTP